MVGLAIKRKMLRHVKPGSGKRSLLRGGRFYTGGGGGYCFSFLAIYVSLNFQNQFIGL